ncbi:uncharacterized protein LOC111347153 [Stylophora pistillata]|uniref:uncharacterized protein LOC111347153 n=1 Tax=Stylophora pistillata TaxID=50429 RepID=UPI000C050DE3|nr:uncharacterized protein LOC111347153 [Stylophora pistillata]
MDIILRFQTNRKAFIEDTEKAFLNVSVAENNRNVLRFLWVDDIKKKRPEVVVVRFSRVIFGVSSSPFLLNATIKHHMERYEEDDPEFVKTFLRRDRADEENLKVTVVNDDTQMLVFEDEQSYTKSTLGGMQDDDKSSQNILGVQWNFVEDQLKFDIGSIVKQASESIPTKKNIASIAAKFYNPIGFLSPVVVQLKLLFLELCESKTDWDDTLEEELLTKWNKLVSNPQDVQPFWLERCYFKEPRDRVVRCDLRGFCDASLNAYNAVAYLKIKTTSQTYTRFLASKTRVAPLSKETIPRLELLGEVILARLIFAVKAALECEVLKKITC